MAAVRIRTRWHERSRARSAPERAGVVAAVAWRVATTGVKSMREAGFELDLGQPYLDFVCECLAFTTHLADRFAQPRLALEERVAFVSALAVRLAEVVEDNRELLLPGAPAGACRSGFIRMFNQRSADYSSCGEDGEAVTFALHRLFAHNLVDVFPAKDRPWVADQVITVTAPEAAAAVEKVVTGLLAPPAVRRRGDLTGSSS